MEMKSRIRLDDYNDYVSDIEFDYLDKKLLQLSIPLSQITSWIIKIGVLVFVWYFCTMELVKLLSKPNSFGLWLVYGFISFIPSLLIQQGWYRLHDRIDLND